MITNYGIGAEAEIPYRARLSSDYAAGRITAGEYNDALHVSELEEKRPFCRATWSDVQAGDIVLTPWDSLSQIVEVRIEKVIHSRPRLLVDFILFADRYSYSFDADETAYIQQRG